MDDQRIIVVSEPIDDDILKRLEKSCEVVTLPFYASEEVYLSVVRKCQAIINRKGTITARVIEASENLKIIARVGSNVDSSRVDLGKAKEKGIWVTVNPGHNSRSVAEFTIGLMLSLVRKITVSDRNIRSGVQTDVYQYNGYELKGKTIGLIGAGHVGSKVAELAKCIGMNVIAYSRSGKDYEKWQVSTDMISVLKNSDVISVHLPLNESTRGILNYDILKNARRGSILINTARGGLLPEQDLARCLKEGIFSGAALDVFEDEPAGPENILTRLPNTILTQHIGGSTREATRRGSNMAVDEVLRVLGGKRPINPMYNI